MARRLPVNHLVTVMIGSLVSICGLWLPWVRKLPRGYVNGQPFYTSEGLPGSETGIGASGFLDWLSILLLGVAVAHLTVVRYRDYRSKYVWAAIGGVLLSMIGLRTVGELRWVIFILAGPFVCVSVFSLYFDWRPVLVVRLVGAFLLLTAAINGYRYLTVERYAVEPGWIVFVTGGLLLVTVGVHQQLPRLRSYSVEE